MKKIFFILILIIATQLAFAHCYHTSTDISGKNTVECAEFWWYSTDNTNKDTIDVISKELWHSSNNINKDTVECIGIWLTDISGNKPVDACNTTTFLTDKSNKDTVKCDSFFFSTDISGNKPVDAIRGIRYSTDIFGNKPVDAIRGIRYSTGNNNTVIETQIKIFLLYTPGNKEKNDSVFLKVKEVIKGKLHNLYNIP